MTVTKDEQEADLLALEIEANRQRAQIYRLDMETRRNVEAKETQKERMHVEGVSNLLGSELNMTKGVRELKQAVMRERRVMGTEELADLMNRKRATSQPGKVTVKKWKPKGKVQVDPEFRPTKELKRRIYEQKLAEKVRNKEQQPDKQRACACLCLLS